MSAFTHTEDAYGDLMPAEGYAVECTFEDGACVCGRTEGEQTDDEKARAALVDAAQAAQDAAYGDSNDTEIELLREALEMALGMLGLNLPEPRDPEGE